jgi:hypothetical protein
MKWVKFLVFLGLISSVNSQLNFRDSNLPIVVITTPTGQQINDATRIMCDMGVIDNGPGVRNYLVNPYNNYNRKIAIEIRGSTSQQYPQKSYGFETQDALGMNNNLPGICDLSTEEIPFQPEYFKIWPNPFDGTSYLGFTLTEYGQMDFELLDNTGRTIFKSELGSFEKGEHAVSIIIDDLATGNYIYLIKKGGSVFGTGKLIKK